MEGTDAYRDSPTSVRAVMEGGCHATEGLE
jgi:hypothetical protein